MWDYIGSERNFVMDNNAWSEVALEDIIDGIEVALNEASSALLGKDLERAENNIESARRLLEEISERTRDREI
jgi:hypothetical protein